MSKFVYQPIFEHEDDNTEYRRLESASQHISISEHEGREILNVDAEALRLLAAEAGESLAVLNHDADPLRHLVHLATERIS